MITEDSQMFKSKTKNQKIKLNSQKKVITTMRFECDCKSAELAEIKAQLIEEKETISNQNKNLRRKNSENKDLVD